MKGLERLELLLIAMTSCQGLVLSAKKLQPPVRPQLVRDALDGNKLIYYFGLGSNMSREKLQNRGVNGTSIGILKMEAAVVPGYRLAFNLRGLPPLEPGMGSLEPIDAKSKPVLTYDSGECHGALVRLTPENYEKVMRSEGVGNGKSDQGYEEIVVDAYPYSRQDRPVKAVALRARSHVRLNFDPCPSARYMNILREGAKELGLKPCYQDFLARHPVQELAAWQRKQALYNLMFTLSMSKILKWRGLSTLQNRLVFLVYAGASASSPVKLASNFLTTFILLPGSAAGFIIFQSLEAVGKTPPFMTRMMSLLS
jgi:hypothetical protein